MNNWDLDRRDKGRMKQQYPMIDKVRTGLMIKKIMQARGLSVKDVQKSLDMDVPQGIYHWFEGKSLPSLDNLYALSELFQVPVDVMLKGNRKYVFLSIQNAACNRLYAYSERFLRVYAG